MRYRFGDCELNTVQQTLCRSGQPVPLEPQVYAVLAYLLRHRHRLVPKDELLRSCWPAAAVRDNALERCISQARRAIGCYPQSQPWIKTYYGRGYHFHGEVREVPPPDLVTDGVSSPPSAPEASIVGDTQPVTLLGCVLTAPPTGASHQPPAGGHRFMESVLAAACTQVVRQQGTVLFGDDSGVLALFGAPAADDLHAAHAIQAALALQAWWQTSCGITPRSQVARSAALHPLQVRMGLHTARLTVWRHPQALQQAWPMLGGLRRLVTRLAQQAAPGTILLSATTARHVRHLVHLAVAPAVHVPDVPTPVSVYRVRHEVSGQPAATRHATSPFVGRAHALAFLQAHWARVCRGHGQVMGIVGEAGMGKTRLLDEFRRRLQGRAVTYIAGQCQAQTAAALWELVGQLCGFRPTDPPGRMRAQVRQALQDAGLSPDAGGPVLLELLGGQGEGVAARGPEPTDSTRQALATLCQLILNRSQQHPTIMVVEDLQWCDRRLEMLCTLLAEQVWPARVLLIGTARPGGAPAWLTQAGATLLTLPPLGPQDSTAVLHAACGTARLPPRVHEVILTKAGGNPLFLEEWTRAVVDASSHQEPLSVPDTIQDVLLARIAHVPLPARRLLQAAAVLGPTGAVRVLQALWEGPEAFAPLLAEVQQRALLSLDVTSDHPRYIFSHMLLQEVAYTSLVPAQRQGLHARAAQALETCYADRLAVVCEALAHHATQALAWYEHQPATEEVQQLTLVLQMARAWSFLGRFADSRAVLEQHGALVTRVPPSALVGRYYFRLGRTYSLLGEYARAGTATRQALAAATPAGDAETMGLAHYELARERFLTGSPRASLQHGQEAVRLLAQTGARWWLGMAHWAVGVASVFLGDFPHALEALAQTETLGASLQDPHLQSYAAFTTGWLEALRGAPTVGIAACQRGCALALDPVNTAHAMGALGVAYLESGMVDQALPLLQQAAQTWERFGMVPMQAWLTASWADAVCMQGETSQAHALAAHSLTRATAAGFPYARGLAHRVLGRVAQARGDLDEATAALTEVLQTFASIEARFEQGRTHLEAAPLAQAHGDLSAARQHLADAAVLSRELQSPVYVTRTMHVAQTLDIALPTPSA